MFCPPDCRSSLFFSFSFLKLERRKNSFLCHLLLQQMKVDQCWCLSLLALCCDFPHFPFCSVCICWYLMTLCLLSAQTTTTSLDSAGTRMNLTVSLRLSAALVVSYENNSFILPFPILGFCSAAFIWVAVATWLMECSFVSGKSKTAGLSGAELVAVYLK